MTTRRQIIVAAEIAPDGLDTSQLDPMVSAAERELEGAGVSEQPEVVLADAGYWSNDHIDSLRERGITPLVAADADKRKGPRKTRLVGPYDFVRRVLQAGKGSDLLPGRKDNSDPSAKPGAREPPPPRLRQPSDEARASYPSVSARLLRAIPGSAGRPPDGWPLTRR